MASTYSSLANVNGGQYVCNLKVSLMRVWKHEDKRKPPGSYTIEFIMVDEQGEKMQGTCYNEQRIKFEKLIVENACLVIRNPKVVPFVGSFRYIKHYFKVILNYDSTIEECLDFDGPRRVLSFAEYKPIVQQKQSEYDSFDLIGLIVRYKKKEPVTPRDGNVTVKMGIQLEDLGGTVMFVTLWGSYAEELDAYMASHLKDGRIEIVIQFAKFKIWKGGYSVSNFESTRLFINEEIEEILQFKRSFFERPSTQSESRSGIFSPVLLYSTEEDLLHDSELCTVVEIPLISQEKQVIIVGTIVGITRNTNWWYDSCLGCKKKVVPGWEGTYVDGEPQYTYQCTNELCKELNTEANTRFLIPIDVKDENGSVVKLAIFDSDACKLVNTNAKFLSQNYLKADVKPRYPAEFEVLLNMKFAFKIEIGNFNLTRNYDTYKIKKLTSDPSIISKLEDKLIEIQATKSDCIIPSTDDIMSDVLHDVQATKTDSITASLQDVQSDCVLNSQGALSITDENLTPTSKKMMVMEKSQFNDHQKDETAEQHNILKRKLEDVDNVDANTSCSATKKHKFLHVNLED